MTRFVGHSVRTRHENVMNEREPEYLHIPNLRLQNIIRNSITYLRFWWNKVKEDKGTEQLRKTLVSFVSSPYY